MPLPEDSRWKKGDTIYRFRISGRRSEDVPLIDIHSGEVMGGGVKHMLVRWNDGWIDRVSANSAYFYPTPEQAWDGAVLHLAGLMKRYQERAVEASEEYFKGVAEREHYLDSCGQPAAVSQLPDGYVYQSDLWLDSRPKEAR